MYDCARLWPGGTFHVISSLMPFWTSVCSRDSMSELRSHPSEKNDKVWAQSLELQVRDNYARYTCSQSYQQLFRNWPVACIKKISLWKQCKVNAMLSRDIFIKSKILLWASFVLIEWTVLSVWENVLSTGSAGQTCCKSNYLSVLSNRINTPEEKVTDSIKINLQSGVLGIQLLE